MTLQSLQLDLDAARAGTLPMPVLAQRMRDAQLPATLPGRYVDVLAGLSDRIESSALFSGESCSFSDTDLLDAVQVWLNRAEALLLDDAQS
jgi:hypothetical protein